MTLVSGLTNGLATGLTSGLVASDAVSFVRNGRFNNLFTRTRASDVTYIDSDGLLKVAGSNEFPIDYSQGFPAQALFEGSTNLCADGDNMETWSAIDATRVLDGTEAIANYKNATLVSANTTTEIHILFSPTSFSFVSGTTYTFSTYAKAGTTNRFQLTGTLGAFGTSQYANFGLTGNGSILASAGGTARIEKVNDDGWYRCSFTVTATSTTSGTSFLMGFIDSDTATRFPTFTGAGENLYLFGGQTEVKPYPTPYIPTNGSTASRAAPSVSITGANFSSFYNQSEGTFVVDLLQPYSKIGTSSYIVDVTNGTANERFLFAMASSDGDFLTFISDGGVTQATIDSTIDAIGVRKKSATSYKENDCAIIATGGSVVTDTSVNLPTVNQLTMGSGGSLVSNAFLNAYIANLTYYPRRLPNSELENLVQ